MKSPMFTKAKFWAFPAITFATIASASAQNSLEAFQGIYAGNDGAFTQVSGGGGQTDASNPFTSTVSFTGQDSHGHTQTMTVDGTAYSSSSYGAVHAYGAGTITNPYYNPSNPVYYDGTTYNPTTGSTDLVGVHGNAGFSDTLTYTGLQGTGYKVNYFFNLDGTSSGDIEAGLNFGTSDPGSPSYNPRTSADHALWISPDYNVTWGNPFQINVDFYGGMTTYVSQHAEGVTYSAFADYSNTLTLAGIQIRDANGAVVNGWTVSSSSGTNYPQAVPEPSSYLGFGLGLVGFVTLRRRKR